MYVKRSQIHGLSLLRGTPEPVKLTDVQKADLTAKWMVLRLQIVSAASKYRSQFPGLYNTVVSGNLPRMDAIFQKFIAGDLAQGKALDRVGDGTIRALTDEDIDPSLKNSLTSLYEAFIELPRRLADAAIAVAATGGKAAGTVLKEAGVDTTQLVDGATSGLKWLAAGLGVGAIVYLVSK